MSPERERLFHEELTRFPAALFQFDPRIRAGWLSDRYFVRTARTLAHAGRDPLVHLQFFAKRHGMLAGTFECIRMLQTQLARGFDYRDLEVETLHDGDLMEPWEVAFRIRGRYRAFAHLETTLDGVLARRSLIATNAARAVDAAGGVPVIYFAPRHDDWRIQTPDGYAAPVGGGGEPGGWRVHRTGTGGGVSVPRTAAGQPQRAVAMKRQGAPVGDGTLRERHNVGC